MMHVKCDSYKILPAACMSEHICTCINSSAVILQWLGALLHLACMQSGDRRPIKVLLTAVGILAISGATAGLLGIGGALIFNPYLLQLGMDPRVGPVAD